MNMSATFTPARAVAQHCAELTERGPRPEERAEHLAAWRRDVAREVAADMSDLLSGTKLEASVSEPEAMSGEKVFATIGAVAANSLLRCGADDQTALLSFEVETAIALTDRSFGGSGEPVLDIVTSLPRSAGLLVEQAARHIAQAIARVSAGGGSSGAVDGDVVVRSESAKRLKPFGPACECVLLRIELTAPDGTSWSAKLAMPRERLDSLLPGMGTAPPVRSEPDPAAQMAAFGTMPLPLEAVLAQVDLSLARLERLSPGDCIPLAVARDVPLRMGATTVALGSLGTREDRMALRLTAVPQVRIAA
ncbi:MAG: FliM/FliN family flagellar motor switch protein [Pseudomonadota bacterium]